MVDTSYIRYAGSPDVFTSAGQYVSADQASKIPNFFSLVKDVQTPRPDVGGPTDFTKVSGTNIPAQISANDLNVVNDANISPADTNSVVDNANRSGQAILDKLSGFLQANTDLSKQIADLNTPTPEETKALSDINNIDSANQSDISKFNNTPGNSFFTFGRQKQAVLDTTALTRLSLVNTLNSQTASRTAKLDAAKTLYDANRNTLTDTLNLYKSTTPENIATQVSGSGDIVVVTRNPLTGAVSSQVAGNIGVTGDDKATVNNLITKYPDAGISSSDSVDAAASKVKNSKIFAQQVGSTSGGGTGGYVPGSNPSVDYWAKLVISGQAKITDVPNPKGSTLRSDVVNAIGQSGQLLLSDKDREKLGVLQNAQNVVNTLHDLANPKDEPSLFPMNSFFRPTTGLYNAVAGALQIGKTGTNASVYNDARKGFVSNIARTLGEKGALSEGDVSRAINNIPTLSDTRAVAQKKFDTLNDILAKARDAVISSSTEPLMNLQNGGAGSTGKNYLGI